MSKLLSEHALILNLSPTIKLCGKFVAIVDTLLALATVAIVIGNHSVANKKKSVAAAEATLRYNLIPRTKLSPDGLAEGREETVTV
jgi:hypothetical protein